MTQPVKSIPDGYHSITPFLMVAGAAKAIDFYREAFGAEEIYRLDMPGGMVGHAELQIGDCRFMLADEVPGMPDQVLESPRTLEGTSVGFHLYVADVDARFARAVAAGATVRREVKDQFYGDRSGTLQDPFGHIWTLATHIEDVTPEEIARRAASLPHG